MLFPHCSFPHSHRRSFLTSELIVISPFCLDFISSQYYGGAYARKRAEIEDGAHGGRAYVAYAEQFQRFFPMVRYTLPITDHELGMIDDPHETVMGRRGEMVGGIMPLPPDMAFTSRFRVPEEKYRE